ncbi:hypothetical protein JOD69_002146 [Methylocaldum sp. RMAD-M]|jgi:hypothetical protein|nr:hypothetical protein [Methylocaldum sp. RMAD-M]
MKSQKVLEAARVIVGSIDKPTALRHLDVV